MYMEGFVSSAADKGNAMCINLLFKAFTINNEGKMTAACLVVFMMGVMCQSLSKYRARRKHSLYTVLVYGIELTLRYFLMLISMSYNVELFCMIILGLSAGHLIFQTDLVWKSASDEIQQSLLDRCSRGGACEGGRGLNGKHIKAFVLEGDPCCG